MGMAHCVLRRDVAGKTADQIAILILDLVEHTLELIAEFDMNIAIRFALKSN